MGVFNQKNLKKTIAKIKKFSILFVCSKTKLLLIRTKKCIFIICAKNLKKMCFTPRLVEFLGSSLRNRKLYVFPPSDSENQNEYIFNILFLRRNQKLKIIFKNFITKTLCY